eukprot:scaffold4622_cov21-Tisochrysis_lutea.AAC.3
MIICTFIKAHKEAHLPVLLWRKPCWLRPCSSQGSSRSSLLTAGCKQSGSNEWRDDTKHGNKESCDDGDDAEFRRAMMSDVVCQSNTVERRYLWVTEPTTCTCAFTSPSPHPSCTQPVPMLQSDAIAPLVAKCSLTPPKGPHPSAPYWHSLTHLFPTGMVDEIYDGAHGVLLEAPAEDHLIDN